MKADSDLSGLDRRVQSLCWCRPRAVFANDFGLDHNYECVQYFTPVATLLCRPVSGRKGNDHEVSHEKFGSMCFSWACLDDGRMQNDGPKQRPKRSLRRGGDDDLAGMDCGLPKRAEQSEDRQSVQGRVAESG